MATFRFVEWLRDWIESQNVFDFDWDFGNRTKNYTKHGITVIEAESVFNQIEAIRVLGEQIEPRVNETRYGLIGLTGDLKHVFVCFAIRGNKIRIVNIRKMSKKERRLYAQLCKE
jgi:uncharacterized DUF497 family protein